jgi:hypothetical protein
MRPSNDASGWSSHSQHALAFGSSVAGFTIAPIRETLFFAKPTPLRRLLTCLKYHSLTAWSIGRVPLDV